MQTMRQVPGGELSDTSAATGLSTVDPSLHGTVLLVRGVGPVSECDMTAWKPVCMSVRTHILSCAADVRLREDGQMGGGRRETTAQDGSDFGR